MWNEEAWPKTAPRPRVLGSDLAEREDRRHHGIRSCRIRNDCPFAAPDRRRNGSGLIELFLVPNGRLATMSSGCPPAE